MSNNDPRDASHYRNGFSNPAGRISELEHLLKFAQKEIDRLRARVAELEDALVWSLGKLSIEVPVSGGNASYIRAFEKADSALGKTSSEPWLLRKQAKAVEDCVRSNKSVYLTDFAGRMIGHCNDCAQRLRQQADEIEKAGGEQ